MTRSFEHAVESRGREGLFDRDLLARLRGATLGLGGLLVLVILLRMGGWAGLSFAVGAGLSVLNLVLLEFVARRVLRPEPMWGPAVYAALGVKLPLLVGGAALSLSVFHLSPLWFALGFSLLFAVLLLKLFGRMLVSKQGGAIGASSTARAARSGAVKFLLALLVAGPVVYFAASGLWTAREAGERAGITLEAPSALAEEPAGHGEATHGEATHGEATHGEATHGGGMPAGAGHGEKEHSGSEAPEFPNWIVLANHLFPDASWAHFLHHWETPLFSLPVVLLLCIVAIAASRNPKMVPGPLQNVVEIAVESFTNFVEGMLGPQGRPYVPFLGTLFFYIWFSNLEGLVPLMKSPTSVLNTTVALAICVFLYVQFTGLTKLGIKRYVMHLAGDPQDVIGWCMVPLLLPLHIIGEFAKPMSLSLRLFGNVFGEDVLLAVFATLILIPLGSFKLGLPLHLPFIFLALLLSSIQALVFTLLSTLYFSQMLPHEEHEGGHH
ncbi:MAG: F0F1 ATP synthase subunit A [Candidatus Eisenbacteria bacterium]